MTADPWDVFAQVFPADPKPAPTTTARPTSATPGTGYAMAALDAECARVLEAPVGTRNHALNRAAFSLGQLVAGGALDEHDVTAALTSAGRSIGLDDSEIGATVGSGMKGGQATPRGVPDPVDTDGWLRSLPSTAERPAAVEVEYDPETGEVVEPTPEQLRADWHARAVERALLDIRVKHDATLAHKAELAAANFRVPPSVWTLADELAIPDEPVTYAIDDLLPTGANALLAAQFKTGKTTFINNYARAFADGTPFLGRYMVNPAGGRVALYNYELDPSMNRRWLRDMGIKNPDRVVVLNLRGFRLPITAPSVEDWVVRWLEEREVTAWVVDPFARAAVGTDENSNTEVGVWLDTLDIIKNRAGVRDLILPTHTGRTEQEAGQERARGATRLDDWADVRWLLTKDENENRFFRATGRDVDVPEELLTFTEEGRRLDIGGGDRKWVKGRDAEARVFAFIKANPGCVTGEIERSGGNKGDNTNAARALVSGNAAAVRIEIDGQKHRHYVNREDYK